jgi:hypothetical protein
VNTYRVWLVYELFRGAITAEQLAWSEEQIQDFAANRGRPTRTSRRRLGFQAGLTKKARRAKRANPQRLYGLAFVGWRFSLLSVDCLEIG